MRHRLNIISIIILIFLLSIVVLGILIANTRQISTSKPANAPSINAITPTNKTETDYYACKMSSDCHLLSTLDNRYPYELQDLATNCVNKSANNPNWKIIKQQDDGCMCLQNKCQRIPNEATETNENTVCNDNSDCRCLNFTGAAFIPGETIPHYCNLVANRCHPCVYR